MFNCDRACCQTRARDRLEPRAISIIKFDVRAAHSSDKIRHCSSNLRALNANNKNICKRYTIIIEIENFEKHRQWHHDFQCSPSRMWRVRRRIYETQIKLIYVITLLLKKKYNLLLLGIIAIKSHHYAEAHTNKKTLRTRRDDISRSPLFVFYDFYIYMYA